MSCLTFLAKCENWKGRPVYRQLGAHLMYKVIVHEVCDALPVWSHTFSAAGHHHPLHNTKLHCLVTGCTWGSQINQPHQSSVETLLVFVTFRFSFLCSCVCQIILCLRHNKRKRHYVFRSYGRPSVVRPLSPITNHAIPLVERFQWNLPQIFITWLGIAGQVFEVRSQRSRSWPDQLTYNGRAIHVDGVVLASKFTSSSSTNFTATQISNKTSGPQ